MPHYFLSLSWRSLTLSTVFSLAAAQSFAQPIITATTSQRADATLSSIQINGANHHGQSSQALTKADRKYWQCVLDNVRSTQNNDAIPIVLAACRALSQDSIER